MFVQPHESRKFHVERTQADSSHSRINVNAFKQCFWMMAHIPSDPKLLASLQEEPRSTISQGTDLLEHGLEQQCPRPKAVYLGVLRLTSSSSTARDIQSETSIRGKVLRPGAKTSSFPTVNLHHDSKIFGKSPERFDPSRFLENQNLSKNPSFRPFGGGKTYCPGRYLATRGDPYFCSPRASSLRDTHCTGRARSRDAKRRRSSRGSQD